MRETRVLAVTLMHRIYGPAVASWLKAFRWAQDNLPGIRLDHLQTWGNPAPLTDGHSIVTAKYIEAQTIFRSGPWWAMIAIEDDMVIPEDTFKRLIDLLANGADIGYGLYVWRHGAPKWSAYTQVSPVDGRSISQTPDAARAAWGKVIDVAGVGMGCTAIKRPVLEQIDFSRRGQACNDWYLAVDAQTHGLVQRCDLGLVCGHISLEPTPRIYYPTPHAPDLWREEMI